MAENPDVVDIAASEAIKLKERLDLLFAYAADHPPKLGILCNRLDKELKELQRDFPPDQKTLEKYKPLIAESRKAYIAIVKENTERELKFLWGEEAGQKKYMEALASIDAFELKHGS